ncbi:hypothetical protein HY837_02150 [archaeon]|nr:hypothetical protein [archaeon]
MSLSELIKKVALSLTAGTFLLPAAGCKPLVWPLNKNKDDLTVQVLPLNIDNRKIVNAEFSPDGLNYLFELPENKDRSQVFTYNFVDFSFSKITEFELNSNQLKINIPRRFFINDHFVAFNNSQDNINQVNLTSKIFDLQGKTVKEFNEFSVDYSVKNIDNEDFVFVQSMDNNKGSCIIYNLKTEESRIISDPFKSYTYAFFLGGGKSIIGVSDSNTGNDYIIYHDAKLINGKDPVLVAGQKVSFEAMLGKNKLLVKTLNKSSNETSLGIYDISSKSVIPKIVYTQFGTIDIEDIDEDLFAFKTYDFSSRKEEVAYYDLVRNLVVSLPSNNSISDLEDVVKLQNGDILIKYSDFSGKQKISIYDSQTKMFTDLLEKDYVGELLVNTSKTKFAVEYSASPGNEMLVYDQSGTQKVFGKLSPVPIPLVWYGNQLVYRSGSVEALIYDGSPIQKEVLQGNRDIMMNVLTSNDTILFLLEDYTTKKQTIVDYDLSGRTKTINFKINQDSYLELNSISPDKKILLFNSEDKNTGKRSYQFYNKRANSLRKIGD